MAASRSSPSADPDRAPRSARALRERLEELERLDLASITVDALARRIGEVCDGSTTPARRLTVPWLCRARAVQARPRSLEELWYPKPESVTTLGRANDIGESTLYASDGEDTAIGEVRPEVGDLVALVRIGLRDPAAVPYVHAIGIGDVPGEAAAGSGEDECARLLRAFVERQFTRDVPADRPHEYALSAAIAKCHRLPGFDGLWYTSSAAQHQGTNVAFLPEAADRWLRAIGCRVVRIEAKLARHVYRAPTVHQARAIAEDGTIDW